MPKITYVGNLPKTLLELHVHVWPACLACLVLMFCKSQHWKHTKKYPKQVCNGGGKHFQQAKGSNYAKPVLLWMSQGQESDHFIKAEWGRFAPVLRGGVLLLLQSDNVGTSTCMMNESPCDRLRWLTLCLQQTNKKKVFHHAVATTVFYITEPMWKKSH